MVRELWNTLLLPAVAAVVPALTVGTVVVAAVLVVCLRTPSKQTGVLIRLLWATAVEATKTVETVRCFLLQQRGAVEAPATLLRAVAGVLAVAAVAIR
jgi:hypothetical protein